jgi:hypothetical protein
MFLRTSQSQQDNNDQAAYEDARRIVSNGNESRPSSINRFIQKLTREFRNFEDVNVNKTNLLNEEKMIEEKIVDREHEWNNYARWLEAINVLRTDDSNYWKKEFLAVKASETSLKKDKQDLEKQIEAFRDIKRVADHNASMGRAFPQMVFMV